MRNQQLPLEVLVNIFSSSDSIRLFQCALVCKDWKEPALKLMHQDLVLGDYHRRLLKRKFGLSKEECDNCFKYGAFVKTLKFVYSEKKYLSSIRQTRCRYDSDGDSDFEGFSGHLDYNFEEFDSVYDAPVEFNELEFISLIEYFPNLKSLDIIGNKNYKRYFQYLGETNSDKCLKQIQVIAAPSISAYNFDSYNAHFALCCDYSDTITSLEIKNYLDEIDIGWYKRLFPQSKDPLFQLSKFEKLKTLKICRGDGTKVTPFKLQEVCPNLTSLDCGIHTFNVKDPEDFLSLEPAYLTKQNDLKSLIITSSNIPLEYVKYLTDCNFTQLKTLKLIMNGVDLYTWVNKIGWFNVFQFARRLHTLDYSELTFYPKNTISERPAMKGGKITAFFKLANAFKGKRNTFCKIDIVDKPKDTYLTDRMIYDPVNGLQLFYGLEHSKNDFPESTPVNGKSFPFTFATPNTASSEIGLGIINNFNVVINQDFPSYMFYFIQYALMKCPNLELLNVVVIEDSNRYISIGKNVKHSYLNKQEHHLSATTTKKNLKSIRTRCFTPGPCLFQMIARHLPAIETIVCTDRDRLTRSSGTALFDIVAFKNLKTFYFDVGFMALFVSKRNRSFYGRGDDYIRFEYTDGSKAIYKYSPNYETFNACGDELTRVKMQCDMATIRCMKNTRIIVGTKALCGDVIAEIENGVLLDYVHIDSHICNEY